MGFFSKLTKSWGQSRSRGQGKGTTPASQSDTGKAVQGSGPWQEQLLLALQAAEPRLSVWLEYILDGLDQAGPELWTRLDLLLGQLEVPNEEKKAFIQDFQAWLTEMEYERVEEFRSELQYRLALALDLEDEEDEQSRLLAKLSSGLYKTKEQLSRRVDQLLKHNQEFDADFWEQFEEILIMADVGIKASQRLVKDLQQRVRQEGGTNSEAFKVLFKQELAKLFAAPAKRISPKPPEVILILGVNGVGKTTTIAKLAYRARMQGRQVLIAAADTFRAAAIEQLEIWARRVGAGFYAKAQFSDPASVAYAALERAQEQGYDQLFVDTAGRLHTNADLMDELQKIKRVLDKKHPGAPQRTILVLDASTGQNALSQTKLFAKDLDINEIVLTKLDGTAKGGVALAVSLEYEIPITYIGLGEKMEDLRPFVAEDFAQALLDV